MRQIPLIFLFILGSLSCFNQKSKEKFYFADNLFSTYSVSEVNKNLVNIEKIEVAPGVWQAAMRFSAHVNDFERVDYCLLVKTPYKVEPGEIKFVQAPSFEKDCSESLFEPALSAPVEFYNIFIDYHGSKLTIKLDQEEYAYQFFNKRKNSLSLSIGDSKKSKIEGETIKIKKMERQRLGDGTICLRVQNDCSVSEDACDDCANSSYYIKNSACLGAYSKVCGMDNCGEKGEPACIRGQISSQVKDYCVQDSPVGFCSGDNRVGCVDGTLICE